MIMTRRLGKVVYSWRYSSVFYFSSKRNLSQIAAKNVQTLKDDLFNLSTLFVPGRYGREMYQIVKPLISADFIYDNIEKFKTSCEYRGVDIDLKHVYDLTCKWLKMKEKYNAIVDKDKEYITELANLKTSTSTSEFENVRQKREKYADVIVSCRNEIFDIEDILMPLLQKIPHFLHPDTPLQFDKVDFSKEPPVFNFDVKSHMDIAKSCIEFFDNSPITYFLTGNLSMLDLGLQLYFSDKMNKFEFLPLSCVDFCKSFIIEAIGYDPYSNIDSIKIKNKENTETGQQLHLVGGASFESFCAYLTNMNVDASKLPLRYYSIGRRYNAANKNPQHRDLFSVVQSTNVHYMILSEKSSEKEFNMVLDLLIMCYSKLSIPYKIVNLSAKKLLFTESHRKQFEIWSPSLKKYIPIAYVSQHDDFISKRLSITHGIEHISEGYCNIIEGTFVNIPILIACIIENFQTQNNFEIPKVLQPYISSLHE